MSVIQIILAPQVLLAALVYAVAALAGMVLIHRLQAVLDHGLVAWYREQLGIPLLRAALMLLFILLAHPVLFGVTDAPSIGDLLAREGLRLSSLFNLIFIVTLLLPLLPVIGGWHEVVLPLQGMAAALLLFSWLSQAMGVTEVSYWPGWGSLALMLLLAVLTHWLALAVAGAGGRRLDRRLQVTGSGEALAMTLVLFLQYPVIVVFCQGLGKQLT